MLRVHRMLRAVGQSQSMLASQSLALVSSVLGRAFIPLGTVRNLSEGNTPETLVVKVYSLQAHLQPAES